METIRLKLNMPLHGFVKGSVISLAARKGKPIDGYWRKRLVEAEDNKCVELIKSPPIKVKKPSKNLKELKDDTKSS